MIEAETDDQNDGLVYSDHYECCFSVICSVFIEGRKTYMAIKKVSSSKDIKTVDDINALLGPDQLLSFLVRADSTEAIT